MGRLTLFMIVGFVLPAQALESPVGTWEGEAAGQGGRCRVLSVKIVTKPGGDATITTGGADIAAQTVTFIVNPSGWYSLADQRGAYTPTMRGQLTEKGGTFEYDNPIGCNFKGSLQKTE